MMDVCVLDISARLAVPAGDDLALLPPASAARVLTLRRNEDRQRRLWVEALARRMLAERLPAPAPELLREASGRPYLAGDPLCLSLSHAGGWVACAVSDAPCGVDVETRPIPPAVARRFFPPEEADAADPLRLWTLKEALCKCLGLSLTEALRTPESALPALGLTASTIRLPDGGVCTAVGHGTAAFTVLP